MTPNSIWNVVESTYGFELLISLRTLPKSRKFLSSNMSDPCLLSCTEGARLKNPSPDNPSTGDQSTTTSDMNSLDSGITDEGSAQVKPIYSFLVILQTITENTKPLRIFSLSNICEIDVESFYSRNSQRRA